MFDIHYSQHDNDVDNGTQLAPCTVCHVHASDTNSNESRVETMPRDGRTNIIASRTFRIS